MNEESTSAHRAKIWLCTGLWGIMILCGLFLGKWNAEETRDQLRGDILSQAEMLAGTLDPTAMARVGAHASSPLPPSSLRLREQLDRYRALHKPERVFHSVRLLAGAPGEGHVVLLESRDRPDETDAVSPGSSRFPFMKPGIHGPYPLHGEPVVTAILHLADHQGDPLVSEIALDLPAEGWERRISVAFWTPVFAAWSAITTLFVMALVNVKMKRRGTVRNPLLHVMLDCVFMFLFGVMVAAGFAFMAQKMEEEERELNFHNLAALRSREVLEKIKDLSTHDLRNLATFFQSSRTVSEEEFLYFTGNIANRNHVRDWYWIEPAADNGEPVFRFAAGGDENGIRPDLQNAQRPSMLETLIRARETGMPCAAPTFRTSSEGRHAVFVSLPLFDPAPENTFRGWVAADFYWDQLIGAPQRTEVRGEDVLRIRIREGSDAGREVLRLSGEQTSDAGAPPSSGHLRPVFAFGNTYLIESLPTEYFLRVSALRLGRWVLTGGVMVSLFAALIGYYVGSSGSELEEKIRSRTAELHGALNRYRDLTAHLPVGLALCARGTFYQMNPRMTEWFHDADALAEKLGPLYQEYKEVDGIRVKEVKLSTRKGVREMQTTLVPVSSEEGGDVTLFMVEDVTRRKRSEKALLDKTEELERYFNSSLDMLCIATLDGTLLNTNPEWREGVGYSEEDLIGRNLLGLVEKEDAEKAKAMLDQLVRREDVTHCELRMRHRNGYRVWFEWRASPVGDLMYATARDVTARIEAEQEKYSLQQQLAQSQKMESIGRLAGGVAHDFNNTLQVIMGNAQLCLHFDHLDETLRNYLKEIQQAAERTASLTRQLLGFARKQDVTPKRLDPIEIIGNSLSIFRRLIGENITLDWKRGSDCWPLYMDESQLEQILVNLLVNARDAMPSGGTVHLGVENFAVEDAGSEGFVDACAPGEYVRISVEDTGTGIEPEVQPLIFEPFMTTKAQDKGTGLGLATVYGIVKQNQGGIRFESEPGTGTRFEIYLPRHVPEEGEEAPAAATPGDDQLFRTRGTALIVEDEEMILNMGALLLEQMGFEVTKAATPGVALSRVQESERAFDLLLTDVMMPEMNGQELADLIRRDQPEIRCVFMSGYTAETLEERIDVDPHAAFIGKPFSIEDLSETIRTLMRDEPPVSPPPE